jgi:hypothetical protein
MKKILCLLFFAGVVFADDYGSFVVKQTDFKELFNKYRVAAPDKTPWVGSWWAYKRDGTTYNGMYLSEPRPPGPTVKFDSYFSLGESTTSWEKENNSCEKYKDDKERYESCKGWWGHCNAWAAAAIMEDEPRKVFLSKNEKDIVTKMTVADQKAYLTELYMENSSAFVGKRSNEKDGDWVWDKDHKTSLKYKNSRYPSQGTVYEAFWDITPRQLFFIFTNYVGVRRTGLVIDRHTGDQVWNQPIAGYRILPIRKGDIKQAKTENGQTVYPVFIRFKMFWAEDGVGELEISKSFDINRTDDTMTYHDEYNHHYTGRSIAFYLFFDAPVKVDEDGKTVLEAGNVVGDGVWYHQTKEGAKKWKEVIVNTHPDFIWLPRKIINRRRRRSRPPEMTEVRVRKIFDNKVTIMEPEQIKENISKIESLKKFEELQDELFVAFDAEMIKKGALITMLLELKQEGFKFVRAPEDFFMILKVPKSFSSKMYSKNMLKIIGGQVDHFFALNPSLEDSVKLQKQVLQLGSKVDGINLVLSIKKKALPLIKQAPSFIKMLSPIIEKPIGHYKRKLMGLIAEMMDSFFVLAPTINDVLSYQALIFEVGRNYKLVIKLKESALSHVSRFQDYVALMDLGIKNPPTSYEDAVFKLAKNNPFENPERDQLLVVADGVSFKDYLKQHRQIIKRFDFSYKDIISHKEAGLKVLKRPQDMVKLLSPGVGFPSKRYLGLITEFIDNNLEEMIEKTGPSVEDLVNLHKFVSSDDVNLYIKEKALPFLDNFKQVHNLLRPGVNDASVTYKKAIGGFLADNLATIKKQTNPNLKKWLELNVYLYTDNASVALREEAISLVKNLDDVKLIFTTEDISDTELVKDKMEVLLVSSIKKLIKKTNPSIDDALIFTKLAQTVDGKISVKKAFLPLVKSMDDYAILVDSYENNPSDEYTEALMEFRKNNVYIDPDGKSSKNLSNLNCRYNLLTAIMNRLKGEFIATGLTENIACKRALKKCKREKKWHQKCRKAQ